MSAPRYVFGPVSSGRLGRSLGVDPLGARICSFDCLYCEAGRTDALTALRRVYAPAETVLAELAAWKAEGHELPDVVTLGGLGEPTLSRECGRIIAGTKALFPRLPVAVLTNASMLSDPEVRADLAEADMVLPSMDSLVEAEFRRINRPHPAIPLAGIRRGLLDFRVGYRGLIFLEILLLAGVNDSDANLEALTAFRAELNPDRVDVVTMSRPGAYGEAKAVDAATLARFREALGGTPAPRRAAAGSSGDRTAEGVGQGIEASLARRPQTAAGLASALGVPLPRVAETLAMMERDGRLRRHVMGGDTFFLPVSSRGDGR
jgi:wyosine [tRNA(Phe)-imidazoG37] synthetase (radical SAM superfamily)